MDYVSDAVLLIIWVLEENAFHHHLRYALSPLQLDNPVLSAHHRTLLLMDNATGQDSMLSNTHHQIQQKSAWYKMDILFGANIKLPGHMT